MKIGLLYNQSKNKRVIKRFISKIQSHVDKHEIVCRSTSHFSDGIVKTKELLQENCDVVVAAGGDGTVLSVINGMMQHNQLVPITILPIGTANDFARELNIYSYIDTIDAIKHAKPVKIDLIKCSYFNAKQEPHALYANSSAGVGMLSAVFQLNHKKSYQWLKKMTGSMAYALASFMKLASRKYYPVTMQINGESHRASIDMLLIRKTRLTGPVSLVPTAKPDSRQLDAVIFYRGAFWRRVKIAIHMMLTKNKLADSLVRYLQAQTISVECDRPMPMDLNGEFLGYTPCRFDVIPQAMDVWSKAQRLL